MTPLFKEELLTQGSGCKQAQRFLTAFTSVSCFPCFIYFLILSAPLLPPSLLEHKFLETQDRVALFTTVELQSRTWQVLSKYLLKE